MKRLRRVASLATAALIASAALFVLGAFLKGEAADRRASGKVSDRGTLTGKDAIESLKRAGMFESLGRAFAEAAPESSASSMFSIQLDEVGVVSPAGAAGDNFGSSVAISGDTVVIGAYREDVTYPDTGAVYVFVRSGTNWILQQKLTAADRGAGDSFGYSVAISGDSLVVGAYLDDITVTDEGSAYVYVRSGTSWAFQQKLTAATDASVGDGFGFSVAISDTTVAVGAYSDRVGATAQQGSVYVFTRSGTSWSRQAQLLASDAAAGDFFGVSVALSGNTAVVGANSDDVGVSANQGSAYVYVRSGTVWSEQQKLVASDGAPGDSFGVGVAVNGDTAVVGSFWSDVGSNAEQGAAYVYTRSGTQWTQQQKLVAPDGAASDMLGRSVSVLYDTIVVGAPLANIGTNADQGAAYVFRRTPSGFSFNTKVNAYFGAAGDNFGGSVSVGSAYMISGTMLDDIGSNADQGSASIFTLPLITVQGAVTSNSTGLSNVTLQLSGPTTAAAQTDANGRYAFSGIIGGNNYTLTPSRAGYVFSPASRTYTPLAADQTQDFIATQCIYSLSPASPQTIPSASNLLTISVTAPAGCAWTGVSNAAWLTVTSGASGSGSGTVTVSVGINTGPARSGTLTIGGATYAIEQANGCTYTVSPTAATVASASGSGSFSVATATGCTWVAASGSSFISTSSIGSGNGVANYTYTANNQAGPARSGTVTVGDKAFTLSQSGCPVSLGPTSYSGAGSTGGSSTFSVSSSGGCTWTATSNSPWITVTSGVSGVDNGTVGFSVAPNAGPNRSGTITVGAQTFTVNQLSGCVFILSPASPQSVPYTAGTLSVSVTASDSACAWTATSSNSFVLVTSGSTGTGSGTAGLSIAANSGPPRSAALTIAGAQFTVNQQSNCTYSLSSGSGTFPATSGSGTFSINTAPSCTWKATSAVSWITVTGGWSGTGSGNIAFTAAANAGPARTGTITVGDQTFTVNQASGCSPSLSVSSTGFSQAGGVGGFGVKTNSTCAWTASTSSAWISISSGTGTGNGSVTFQVQANSGTARSGTIVVGATAFTVTQSPPPVMRNLGDFDGDGKTDIGVFRRSGVTGGAEYWYLKSADPGSAVVAYGFGESSDVAAPADFTGDGKTDLAIFRPADGHWYILRSEDSSFYAFPFGMDGDVPVPADYDGDGRADAAVYRPSTGYWFVSRSSDGATDSIQFGAAADKPIPADYDGDGKTDVAVWRPDGASGAEWWYLGSVAGPRGFGFGESTDKPVPADYTGDLRTDLAFFRPGDGQWYVLRSEDSTFYAFPFGGEGDVPSPGDYDGDGRADAAVFRSGQWYIYRSRSGVVDTVPFGGPTDTSLTSIGLP